MQGAGKSQRDIMPLILSRIAVIILRLWGKMVEIIE